MSLTEDSRYEFGFSFLSHVHIKVKLMVISYQLLLEPQTNQQLFITPFPISTINLYFTLTRIKMEFNWRLVFVVATVFTMKIAVALHSAPVYEDRPVAYGALPPENYCMKAPAVDGKRTACGGFTNRECDQFCDKYGFRNGFCGHQSIEALKKKYCLCHNGVCDTGFLRD